VSLAKQSKRLVFATGLPFAPGGGGDHVADRRRPRRHSARSPGLFPHYLGQAGLRGAQGAEALGQLLLPKPQKFEKRILVSSQAIIF